MSSRTPFSRKVEPDDPWRSFPAWAVLILSYSAALEIAKQQPQAQTALQYQGEKKSFQSFPNSANHNKLAKENKDFTAGSSSRGREKKKSRGK